MPGVPENIGPYRVLALLGEGAMGSVYRAEDPHLGRQVAIKTIQFGSAPEEARERQMRLRFAREARSAASLNHPNIITIHFLGEHDGHPYLVMELIDGWSLAKLIHSNDGPDIVRPLLQGIRQTAQALDYAHSRGIIHRDIKPANILVGRDRVFKIADFGIARILDASKLTATGASLGTPRYVAPECLRGEAGPASDQYGLGVTAYEAVTRNSPYSASTPEGLYYQILNEPPVPAQAFDASLPAGVEAVFQKVLAKNPADRFPSCEGFVDALIAAMDGLPPAETSSKIPALPPPPAPRSVVSPPPLPTMAPTRRRSFPWGPVVAGLLISVGLIAVIIYATEYATAGANGFRVPATLQAIVLPNDMPPPPFVSEPPPAVAEGANVVFPSDPAVVVGPKLAHVGFKVWNATGWAFHLVAEAGDGTLYFKTPKSFWAVRDGKVQWGFEGFPHTVEATRDGRLWGDDVVVNRNGQGGHVKGLNPFEKRSVIPHYDPTKAWAREPYKECDAAGFALDHQCENFSQESGIRYFTTVTKNIYAFGAGRKLAWTGKLPCRTPFLMVARGGLVILGCRSERDWVAETIFAMREGKVVWTFKGDDGIDLAGGYNTPGVAVDREGTSYFTDVARSPHLYAVDRNGRQLWKYGLGQHFTFEGLQMDPRGRLFISGKTWIGGDNGATIICFADSGC